MEAATLARQYYEAIDESDYEALSSLLAADFRQERPDRTFEGRETFVRFMRDRRPETDTTHEVHRVFESAHDGESSRAGEEHSSVAVEGTVYRENGEVFFSFVDVFEVEDDALSQLKTFTG